MDPEPFTRAAWEQSAPLLASSNDPGCVRGGMALDLLRQDLLRSKTPAEFVGMLGEPTGNRGDEWAYELGQCSVFGWKGSELRVHFSWNGVVKNASFRRTP